MAWQLLYTSAPRLLEAGRSGFGTVARHRQISPLLVSTIERASQFARGPGLDTARIIFCHRIVAVAGGRFHVLSCIRDAGADYTGRTNHLAHHLIAEQREIAALGPRGASPADVLLAMSWAGSWEEAPRFLEAGDEIALANFAPQAVTQWAQITGDARHAWLLASGEASRGAYLLCAPGTDARALFAESLRLMPDRLWQVPFTTALQPSDESSDFRWIALEVDSPLRAQAESSSRPVLDLTRPETLPAPEVPANAAIANIPRPTALGTPARETNAPKTPAPVPVRARAAKPGPAFSPAKRANKKWLIIGGAAVLLAAIGFSIVHPLITARQNLRTRRDQLQTRLTAPRIFSPQTTESFSKLKTDQLSTAEQIVTEIEKATDAVKNVRFDKMRDGKSGDALRQMAGAANLEIPAELPAFADRVRQADFVNTELSKPAASERAAYENAVRQRDPIEAFAKETQATNAFSTVIEELRKNRERAEAAALLALLHPRDSQGENLPPVETALVKERLARTKPADAGAAKHFADAEKLMKAWETVQSAGADKLDAALRDARATWPGWLVKQAETTLGKTRADAAPKPAANTAKAFAATPLYFFNGLGALKDARFPELEKGLTFQLHSSPGATPVPLINPAGRGTLMIDLQQPVLFVVNETVKQITHERAAENLARPFVLSAGRAGVDVMQLWFVGESDKPLLPKKSVGLSRKDHSLVLDPAALGLPGVPTSRMNLRLPESIKAEPLPVKDWAADLAPVMDEFARSRRGIERQMKPLESGAPAAGGDKTARFAEWKKTIVKSVADETAKWAEVERVRIGRRESDEQKRKAALLENDKLRRQRIEQAQADFGDEAQTLAKQVGGCIKAFSREAVFGQRDPLFNAGAALCLDAVGADAKRLADACATALTETRKIKKIVTTSEMIARYQAGLNAIENMILLLSPETVALKGERDKAAGQLTAKQSALQRIEAHPLMTGAVPPGLYRLSVFADGAEIPLMEIEIPR